MTELFQNRRHAGQVLAEQLVSYRGRKEVVVLGLPRGGVPVAFEVASFLHVPLDVFIVRKLGFPGHEEYAMGAIASGGVTVLNPDLVGHVQLSEEVIGATAAREQRELERREALYREGRPAASLKDRTVILVDDGLATGSTMRAAVTAVRRHQPARIVVAVPVASPETSAALAREVDELVCVLTPAGFSSVGRWYADFDQTSDGEVRELLAASPPLRAAAAQRGEERLRVPDGRGVAPR